MNNQKFAENLANKGELHFNNAAYYDYLYEKQRNRKEVGQADPTEGGLLKVIRKNYTYPIYCLSMVTEDDIYVHEEEKRVRFPRRLIEDFWESDSGYAVFFDYVRFIEELKHTDFNGYAAEGKPVIYKDLSYEDQSYYLNKNNLDHLFYKHTCFHYQKEYRICIYTRLPNTVIAKDKKGNLKLLYTKDGTEFRGKNYNIPQLNIFSVLLKKEDFNYSGDNQYYVPLNSIERK